MDEGGNRRTRLVRSALLLCLALTPRAASAQTFTLGGGGGVNVQRFDGDRDFNRLDGSSASVFLQAGTSIGPLGAAIEASWDAPSANEETTEVVVNGRPATILSQLRRSARSIALYGRYAHALSPRVRVAGVAGVSFLSVERGFTTNAGNQVLSTPSQPVFGTTFSDDFAAWSVGADVLIDSRRPDVRYVAGFRVEPLTLESEISGYRYRVQAGLVWSSR